MLHAMSVEKPLTMPCRFAVGLALVVGGCVDSHAVAPAQQGDPGLPLAPAGSQVAEPDAQLEPLSKSESGAGTKLSAAPVAAPDVPAQGCSSGSASLTVDVCGDGIDNDCDGLVDGVVFRSGPLPSEMSAWCLDCNGDCYCDEAPSGDYLGHAFLCDTRVTPAPAGCGWQRPGRAPVPPGTSCRRT
ncbi:MAG: hypothetical protein RLZZ450_1509 [Pseudomonadota bacterium]|jgi:hypothetical protein